MEDEMLVWDEVEHASGYIVYFEDEEHETTFFHYDLSELTTPGTYEIDVMAVGDENYIDSQWSNFSYTVRGLEPEYDEAGYQYLLLPDGSGYEFSLGKGTLGENLVIPDTFKGLPVKRIAANAFPTSSQWNVYNVLTKNIQFPAHLESIGDGAFLRMSNVEEVVIPDSVTVIERYAFGECIHLKHVTFPKNLKVLGDWCFAECSLEKIVLPDGLEEIGEWAFSASNSSMAQPTFTSVIIPDSVKRIGACAFRSVSSLQEVTLPTQNLEWMGYAVFGNTAWTEARSDETIIIGDLLYEYNSDEHGETYTVPADVKKIAGQAFSFSEFNEVHIPDGVKLIGENIFTNCNNLKKVRLPADLTEIPERAFNCCKNLTDIVIPKSVTTIGEDAFNRCESLSGISLPEGLKTIGEGAFSFCLSFTEVEIPESVVSLGGSAFSGCESLSEISLPEGLEMLDDYAFSHCTSLKEIIIPASLNYLGERVFYECTTLENIYFEGTKQQLGVLKAQNDYPTTLYDGTTYASVLFANATVYCYAETKPISGNYWHYVNGIPTIW